MVGTRGARKGCLHKGGAARLVASRRAAESANAAAARHKPLAAWPCLRAGHYEAHDHEQLERFRNPAASATLAHGRSGRAFVTRVIAEMSQVVGA